MFTRATLNALVNRNTILKALAPGNSGEDKIISTGGNTSKTINFDNEEMVVIIDNRTFTVHPELFPSMLKGIVNTPISIHINKGLVKLRGSGSIGLSDEDKQD